MIRCSVCSHVKSGSPFSFFYFSLKSSFIYILECENFSMSFTILPATNAFCGFCHHPVPQSRHTSLPPYPTKPHHLPSLSPGILQDIIKRATKQTQSYRPFLSPGPNCKCTSLLYTLLRNKLFANQVNLRHDSIVLSSPHCDRRQCDQGAICEPCPPPVQLPDTKQVTV